MSASEPGGRRVRIKANQHADAAAAVDIRHAVALVAQESTDAQVLADDQDFIPQGVGHGLLPFIGQGGQGRHVGGVLLGHNLGQSLDEILEIRVLGHEVGLGVHFDDHAHLLGVVHIGVDKALGGNAGGFFSRGGQALFPQEIDGLLHVAIAGGQRFFAVHHAHAGLLAQGLDVFRSKCHVIQVLSWWIVERFRLRRELPQRRRGLPQPPRRRFPRPDGLREWRWPWWRQSA